MAEPEERHPRGTSEQAVESWLRTEAVAAYDELRADESQALGAADMREHLARERLKGSTASDRHPGEP